MPGSSIDLAWSLLCIGTRPKYRSGIGMQVGGWRPPHHPLKITSKLPYASKIQHQKPFQETPQGVFQTENKNFFSASGRMYKFPCITFCPLRHAQKWSLFMWKPFNVVKKANQTLWSLWLIAVFRWYKWNGETVRSKWKKITAPPKRFWKTTQTVKMDLAHLWDWVMIGTSCQMTFFFWKKKQIFTGGSKLDRSCLKIRN